ncbi:MAG: WbqC family protein [Flavobacteriaceae bacterium]|nr:WbqC family protein [Mangrovimonas sp.]
MEVLLSHTYFPSIAHFILLLKSEKVWFEAHDNYEKQTLRNRTYIYGANGKQALSIPVNYTQKNRQLFKDVEISNSTPWQSIHRKSIESAYKSSPFFEFYEDDLEVLFSKKPKFLLDHNIKCLETIVECLQISLDSEDTTIYEKEPQSSVDFRPLVQANTKLEDFESYTQVFSDKHGFLSNLSILDLLFNEGPNTVNYLKNQASPTLL